MVVFASDHRPVNPPLRFAQNERARHKTLDILGRVLLMSSGQGRGRADAMHAGDFSLCGFPVAGQYVATKPGHRLNFQLVTALMANPENYFLD